MGQDTPIGSTVADRSLQIATALSAEVAVLRERLEIFESLIVDRGLLGPDDIDSYDAGTTVAAGRRAFLERVFGAMRVNGE